VGTDNIFIFGLQTEEVRQVRARGYDPRQHYYGSARIRRIIDGLDHFSGRKNGIFDPIRRLLLDGGDPYLHLADLVSYLAAQENVARTYAKSEVWSAKAIRNVARMSRFSSDRTIEEYARDIWNIVPVRP
jgi:glycogen phosphorylase